MHYFPQRIAPPFSYNAMKPENEARAKSDNALLKQYADVIENGTITRTATPAVKNSMYAKPANTLVWPDSEVAKIVSGTKTLTITLDYKGRTAPAIELVDSALPIVVPPIPAPNADIEAMKSQVAMLQEAAARSEAKANAASAVASAALASVESIKSALKAIGT